MNIERIIPQWLCRSRRLCESAYEVAWCGLLFAISSTGVYRCRWFAISLAITNGWSVAF